MGGWSHDWDGHIGAIGGANEKAAAAKEHGKTLFLLPAENRIITRTVQETGNYGMFSVARQVQYQESAEDYIEKNIGIKVTFVNTIDDVLSYALLPAGPGIKSAGNYGLALKYSVLKQPGDHYNRTFREFPRWL